jgi:archaemetzincin
LAGFVYLFRLGKVDPALLDLAERCIRDQFRLPTRIAARKIDLAPTFDSVRNQYHSTKLLREVITDPPGDALRLLGLTEVDLFIPIFTFLFGEAQLHGPGTILSVHRLRHRFYGLPENRDQFHERVRKEVMHELGHTFGLVHCFDPVCAMRSSTYVEEIDLKSEEFCDGCRLRLEEKLTPLR